MEEDEGKCVEGEVKKVWKRMKGLVWKRSRGKVWKRVRGRVW